MSTIPVSPCDPRETYCHFQITTNSGLSYSRLDAWKYRRYFPRDPQMFTQKYSDMLFGQYKGIVSVKATVIYIGMQATRELIREVEEFDMHVGIAEAHRLFCRIIGQYEYTRNDYEERLSRGDY